MRSKYKAKKIQVAKVPADKAKVKYQIIFECEMDWNTAFANEVDLANCAFFGNTSRDIPETLAKAILNENRSIEVENSVTIRIVDVVASREVKEAFDKAIEQVKDFSKADKAIELEKLEAEEKLLAARKKALLGK